MGVAGIGAMLRWCDALLWFLARALGDQWWDALRGLPLPVGDDVGAPPRSSRAVRSAQRLVG